MREDSTCLSHYCGGALFRFRLEVPEPFAVDVVPAVHLLPTRRQRLDADFGRVRSARNRFLHQCRRDYLADKHRHVVQTAEDDEQALISASPSAH